MKNIPKEDTIIAISTPVGEGGIAIVRLSGPDALKIADEIFVSKDKKKASKFKTYTTHYGHLIERGKAVDEVILTVMKAPKSYTKEDIVEINCHGGIQAAKKALDLAASFGARVAEPGEFTKRAFLNGRIDLAQAEAVLDIIRAKTEGSLKVAVNQLEGGLSRWINDICEKILDITSHIEASIDFPEEDTDIIKNSGSKEKVEEVIKKLKSLIESYGEGMIFREGVIAIICGKPNVGKSSLMNLLLKRDRVIVSPVPGTTRDAVEEVINIKGVPVRLVDTAGMGEIKDHLDSEAARHSRRYLELADIVILMLDASVGMDDSDLDILRLVKAKKKILAINKIDAGRKITKKELQNEFRNGEIVEISVKEKKGLDILEKRIHDMVWSGSINQGESAIVSNARHKELLDKSLENMLSVKKAIRQSASPETIAIDLKEALYNMGVITGRSVSDDILDRIFEQFCIGK